MTANFLNDNGQRDALTGVYARATFNSRLQEEAVRSLRYGYPFSVLLIDIDHFKSINDAFGHSRGDQVLVAFAERVRMFCRSSDLIFRYGGDEFIVLLPHTDMEVGIQVGQRLLAGVQDATFGDNPPLSLTTSIGIANYPLDAQTAETLFEIADQRHYQAKRLGRACLVSEDAAHCATISVVAEPPRLIERDHPLEGLRGFLNALPGHRRGVLLASGPERSGRTRFLGEARKMARLQGYGVLAIQGRPALKERVFGALAEACAEWRDLPIPSVGRSRLAVEIQKALDYRSEVGLLVTVDDQENVDRDTLAFLHDLFLSADFSRMALVYGTPAIQQGWPQEAPLRTSVSLEPLSQNGVRIWLRHVLQWEAPEPFVAWLHRETRGLPGWIQDGLVYLMETEILKQAGAEWIYQAETLSYPISEDLARSHPPARPNLPFYPTQFIGREIELRQLKSLLREHRLIVVKGSAGIGKTRLAVQAAAESAQSFTNGVCYVSLVGLSSTDYLTYAIAEALQFTLAGPQDPKEQLLKYLHTNRGGTLVVLDSFEHLADGLHLLSEILNHTSGITFLVTSRQHLGIPAVTFELGGLLYPENERADDVDEYISLQLFVRIARRTYPNFELNQENRQHAARICRLVGGVPLLIELAAAWAPAFSCAEIAAGIERNLNFLSEDSRLSGPANGPGLTDGRLSLAAVFDSLWNLLSKSEQSALRKLSVFRGGFSEEAAARVAGASPFFLDALVGKSYLRRARQGHFVLHELLRQFLAEKLRAYPSEMLRARQRHCTTYARFVSRRQQLLRSKRQALQEISAEMENVRAAWECAIEQARLDDLEALVNGLTRFYDQAGMYQEAVTGFGRAAERLRVHIANHPTNQEAARRLLGRLLTEQANFLDRGTMYQRAYEVARSALVVYAGHPPCAEQAAMYQHLGRALRGLGDYDGAVRELNQALALAVRRRDDFVAPDSLCELGEIYLSQGRHSDSTRCYQQALEIYRQIKDRRGQAQAFNNLGMVAKNTGSYSESSAYFSQALKIFQEIGDRRGEAQALNNLGIVSQNLTGYREARLCYEKALSIYRDIGDLQAESWGLNCIGFNLYILGEHDSARPYYEAALTLCQETGDRWGENISMFNLGLLSQTVGRYADAGVLLQNALRICREIGDRWGEVWRLSHLGLYYHICDKNETALDLCRQAQQIAEEVGDRPATAKALAYQGHALSGLGRWEEARQVYEHSLQRRRELHEAHLAMEPLAGLAQAAQKLGDPQAASQHVEEILSYLEQGGRMDGIDEPFRVYLICVQVLAGAGDERTAGFIRRVQAILLESAGHIADPEMRRSFLEDAPLHRKLMQIGANEDLVIGDS